MKKSIYVILVIFLLSGWIWVSKDKTVMKIDGIEINLKEFNNAFQASRFALQGEGAKEDFLDTYISRKLILKEAERLGLDKDPEFLRDVQLFWEQSLLKRILARKLNELSLNIRVEDKEVRDYYQDKKDEEFIGKELDQVYDQIKFFLFKEKQGQIIKDWTDSLRQKAKVKIDYSALGFGPK